MPRGSAGAMTGPTSLSCASSSDLVPATAGRPSQTHQLSRCRSRAEHALSRGGRHGFPSCHPREGPPGVLLQGPECARLWSSHTPAPHCGPECPSQQGPWLLPVRPAVGVRGHPTHPVPRALTGWLNVWHLFQKDSFSKTCPGAARRQAHLQALRARQARLASRSWSPLHVPASQTPLLPAVHLLGASFPLLLAERACGGEAPLPTDLHERPTLPWGLARHCLPEPVPTRPTP